MSKKKTYILDIFYKVFLYYKIRICVNKPHETKIKKIKKTVDKYKK